jgi:hypothetical protein
MSTDWKADRKNLTHKDIAAVLAFLPVFEQPGFCFGRWLPEPGASADAATQLGYCELAPEVCEFLEVLYERRWMYPFVWMDPSWQERMEALRRDPARIAEADLETLRQMLITYVRADRFCEGELLGAFEDDGILAILRRVKEITGG